MQIESNFFRKSHHGFLSLLLLLVLKHSDGFSQSGKPETPIQNFRPAIGLPDIYRCAQTDCMATYQQRNCDASQILWGEAGLIIDLRSDSERNETAAQDWTLRAGISIVDTVDGLRGNRRNVLRLDPLSPGKLMEYIEENWLSPRQRAEAAWYKLVDGAALDDLRIESLNQHGLLGMYEAILETGRFDLRQALEAITLHLEKDISSPIVIHCVQGKDRTGLLVMLLQSIIGIEDQDIIQCYHETEGKLSQKTFATGKRLDRQQFRAAPRQVMIGTLEYLRSRYGSITGYLEEIGVDHRRLRRALQQQRTLV